MSSDDERIPDESEEEQTDEPKEAADSVDTDDKMSDTEADEPVVMRRKSHRSPPPPKADEPVDLSAISTTERLDNAALKMKRNMVKSSMMAGRRKPTRDAMKKRMTAYSMFDDTTDPDTKRTSLPPDACLSPMEEEPPSPAASPAPAGPVKTGPKGFGLMKTPLAGLLPGGPMPKLKPAGLRPKSEMPAPVSKKPTPAVLPRVFEKPKLRKVDTPVTSAESKGDAEDPKPAFAAKLRRVDRSPEKETTPPDDAGLFSKPVLRKTEARARPEVSDSDVQKRLSVLKKVPEPLPVKTEEKANEGVNQFRAALKKVESPVKTAEPPRSDTSPPRAFAKPALRKVELPPIKKESTEAGNEEKVDSALIGLRQGLKRAPRKVPDVDEKESKADSDVKKEDTVRPSSMLKSRPAKPPPPAKPAVLGKKPSLPPRKKVLPPVPSTDDTTSKESKGDGPRSPQKKLPPAADESDGSSVKTEKIVASKPESSKPDVMASEKLVASKPDSNLSEADTASSNQDSNLPKANVAVSKPEAKVNRNPGLDSFLAELESDERRLNAKLETLNSPQTDEEEIDDIYDNADQMQDSIYDNAANLLSFSPPPEKESKKSPSKEEVQGTLKSLDDAIADIRADTPSDVAVYIPENNAPSDIAEYIPKSKTPSDIAEYIPRRSATKPQSKESKDLRQSPARPSTPPPAPPPALPTAPPPAPPSAPTTNKQSPVPPRRRRKSEKSESPDPRPSSPKLKLKTKQKRDSRSPSTEIDSRSPSADLESGTSPKGVDYKPYVMYKEDKQKTEVDKPERKPLFVKKSKKIDSNAEREEETKGSEEVREKEVIPSVKQEKHDEEEKPRKHVLTEKPAKEYEVVLDDLRQEMCTKDTTRRPPERRTPRKSWVDEVDELMSPTSPASLDSQSGVFLSSSLTSPADVTSPPEPPERGEASRDRVSQLSDSVEPETVARTVLARVDADDSVTDSHVMKRGSEPSASNAQSTLESRDDEKDVMVERERQPSLKELVSAATEKSDQSVRPGRISAVHMDSSDLGEISFEDAIADMESMQEQLEVLEQQHLAKAGDPSAQSSTSSSRSSGIARLLESDARQSQAGNSAATPSWMKAAQDRQRRIQEKLAQAEETSGVEDILGTPAKREAPWIRDARKRQEADENLRALAARVQDENVPPAAGSVSSTAVDRSASFAAPHCYSPASSNKNASGRSGGRSDTSMFSEPEWKRQLAEKKKLKEKRIDEATTGATSTSTEQPSQESQDSAAPSWAANRKKKSQSFHQSSSKSGSTDSGSDLPEFVRRANELEMRRASLTAQAES